MQNRGLEWGSVNAAEEGKLDARQLPRRAPSSLTEVGETSGVEINDTATLLYDAECGLCRACVRWLGKWNRRGWRQVSKPWRIRFEPLQSELGQTHLRHLGLPTEDFDSVVFVRVSEYRAGPEYLLRTDALVAALKHCGGGARAVGTLLCLVPRTLRDAGYRLVARLRHRFW